MTPVTAIFQDKLDKLVPRILLELRMTEVVVTTGAIRRAKLHSNRLHQQTNTQLFTGRMHFLSSNQQCQSTEGKSITFHWLALPRSLGVFQSCPWPLNAPGYLGGRFASLASGLWCQHPYSVLALSPFSRWTLASWYQNDSILEFIGAKGDGGGGNNWSYKMCRVLALQLDHHH